MGGILTAGAGDLDHFYPAPSCSAGSFRLYLRVPFPEGF